MADPRMSYDYTDLDKPLRASYDIDGVSITYSATEERGTAVRDRAVRLMPGTAKTVELVGDGEAVLGQLISVESDGTAVVQLGPMVTLPGGDGATLTPGTKIVGDLGAGAAEGYVRSVAAATLAEVAVARGSIQDATTTTAVQVLMFH